MLCVRAHTSSLCEKYGQDDIACLRARVPAPHRPSDMIVIVLSTPPAREGEVNKMCSFAERPRAALRMISVPQLRRAHCVREI